LERLSGPFSKKEGVCSIGKKKETQEVQSRDWEESTGSMMLDKKKAQF